LDQGTPAWNSCLKWTHYCNTQPSSLGYTIIDTQTRRETLKSSSKLILDELASAASSRSLDPPAPVLTFIDLPTEILYCFAKSHLHLPDAVKLALVSRGMCATVSSLLMASDGNFASRQPSLRLVNCIMQDYVGYQLRAVNPSCDFTISSVNSKTSPISQFWPPFSAPEVLAYGFSEQSYDMFCIGSIVHILYDTRPSAVPPPTWFLAHFSPFCRLCGRVHYHNCTPDSCNCDVHMLFDQLTNTSRETNFSIAKNPNDPNCLYNHLSPECVEFLSQCLVLRTIPTLSAAKALDHPWLNVRRPLLILSFALIDVLDRDRRVNQGYLRQWLQKHWVIGKGLKRCGWTMKLRRLSQLEDHMVTWPMASDKSKRKGIQSKLLKIYNK